MNTAPIRVNGHDVHARLSGADGAPVVMLAHSILSDMSMWDEICAGLEQQWQVLRYDLRGHGCSSATTEPYDMGMLAEDACGLIDALGLSRVHFVGASLGGMLGQRLAAVHGDRLLSLTLSNTAAKQTTPQSWSDRIALVESEGTQALADTMVQRWFSGAFLRENAALVQKAKSVVLSTSIDGFIGCAQAVRSLDHLALLSAIAVPTLIVSGANDLATPPMLSREIAARIPHAQVVDIPQGVHMSPVERPAEYLAHLRSFLNTITSSGTLL